MNRLFNFAARPNVFQYTAHSYYPVTSHSLVNQHVCTVRDTHEVRLRPRHWQHNLIKMSQKVRVRCDALTTLGYPLADCSLYVETDATGSVTVTGSLVMFVTELGAVDTSDVVGNVDPSTDFLGSRQQDMSHAVHIHKLYLRNTLPPNQSMESGAWVSRSLQPDVA
jgi:hypothetical protein